MKVGAAGISVWAAVVDGGYGGGACNVLYEEWVSVMSLVGGMRVVREVGFSCCDLIGEDGVFVSIGGEGGWTITVGDVVVMEWSSIVSECV